MVLADHPRRHGGLPRRVALSAEPPGRLRVVNESIAGGEVMRITVIGTGYLGAVHAACMADTGHDVLGVDTDAQKIAALQDGHAPFFEPGLEEILVRAVGS